jgi:PAS domain-containing protein
MKDKSSNNDYSSESLSGKPSLTRIIFIIPMLVATIVSVCLTMYFSIVEVIHFKEGNEKLKKEFPLQQRHELKYRILGAKDFIQFARTHSFVYINLYVNKQLQNAERIIIKDVQGSEASGLFAKATVDSLNRFFENSALHFAVTNEKGEPVYVTPSEPSANLKTCETWRNFSECLIRDGVYKSVNEWLSKASSNKFYNGIIKRSLPSGLNLITKIELRDSTRLIQELILDSLSQIRYDNGEYIFINTFEGKGLITKGVFHKTPLDILSSKDSNWIQIFRQEVICANEVPGNFITYNWQKNVKTEYSEKVSFISGITDWKWIIGTGMHSRDIEPILQGRRDELRSLMLSDLFKFLGFLVLFFIVIYLITRWVSNLISSSIHIFFGFFKNAANSLETLDESKFHFKEFHSLGRAANQMISERDRIASDLATEQSRLKYIIDAIPDLIFFKDKNSLFVGCNRAFEKYVGLTADEIIGCSEFDLFPDAHAEVYLSTDKILL